MALRGAHAAFDFEHSRSSSMGAECIGGLSKVLVGNQLTWCCLGRHDLEVCSRHITPFP
jgi:hypothetical protein